MTDPDGNQTAWTYDELDRVSTETECVGTSGQATASYLYDLDGHVVQSTDYDHNVIQYVYDNMGRELHEELDVGHGHGRVDDLQLRPGRPLARRRDPASASEAFAYDCDGNLVSSTAGYAGLSSSVTLQNVYDINGYRTDQYASLRRTAAPRPTTTTAIPTTTTAT